MHYGVSGDPCTKKEKRQSSAKKEIPIVEDNSADNKEENYNPYRRDERDYSLPMGADRNPKNIDTSERVREDLKSYNEAARPGCSPKELDMISPSPSRRSSKSSRSGSASRRELSTAKGLDHSKLELDGDYLSPQYAKGLAQDNLKHQPLPDTVTQHAYKSLQMKRDKCPGLAIPEVPKAAAVGAQKYVSPGPTQCSKMMVYRPKTAGDKVPSPEPIVDPPRFSRKKDLGPIDLAICWDLVLDKTDEPKKPIHIDGSTDAAGPSVFTLVKRLPSDDGSPTMEREAQKSGKHLVGVKKGWDEKPVNPSAVMDIINNNADVTDKVGKTRPHSSRKNSSKGSGHGSKRRSASSVRESLGSLENRNPNIPVCNGSHCGTDKNSGSGGSIKDALKASFDSSFDSEKLSKLKHHRSSPNLSSVGIENSKSKQKMLFSRPCMACETKDPKTLGHDKRPKSDYKMAFKAGIPNNNSNHSNKSDSTGSRPHTAKHLSVPKPRTPYAKRSYSINTLAPPFSLWPGTTGMDYPEHWRLASVYQHSYKPLESRKKPLLQGVYH
ncbi:hypothetical protein GE061_006160 [Apolygus lucorum]|uniref:DUF4812 domain-containing protein n=1 Tax=Apolygus lucorum TaxID=248454 RepID=A0A8S9WSZ0_APOLU|nr:hypothetical protein GE061_006160 [Apolygus lucorum]